MPRDLIILPVQRRSGLTPCPAAPARAVTCPMSSSCPVSTSRPHSSYSWGFHGQIIWPAEGTDSVDVASSEMGQTSTLKIKDSGFGRFSPQPEPTLFIHIGVTGRDVTPDWGSRRPHPAREDSPPGSRSGPNTSPGGRLCATPHPTSLNSSARWGPGSNS